MKFVMMLALMVSISSVAVAQNTSPNGRQNPMMNKGQKPTTPKNERAEKIMAAVKECQKETGVKKPEPGQRPNETDRAKMRACMEKKGVIPPRPQMKPKFVK